MIDTATALLVTAGGAVGAPTRYVVDRFVQARHSTPLPLGTLAVNLAGSFVLGLVTGLAAHGAASWVVPAIGTGFCGALTTFSTFSVENVRLLEQRRYVVAAANVTVSLVAGLALCALGVVAGG